MGERGTVLRFDGSNPDRGRGWKPMNSGTTQTLRGIWGEGALPPLAVPIWYDYQPGGEVIILTSSKSVKGLLLEAAEGFSLCAQTEEPPYQYVTVEGPITGVRPADREADTRPMARRYLGRRGGDNYTDSTPHSPDETVYSMRPERWYTVDYSKLYA